ncbi:MAG: peptidoglycan DD-metalloendopeptidase family protein [Chloroflexi bacterium]|nr:peptidoglycan DD-metalloendopeptidase family protein [Chloroflexota bacterium]
MRAIVTFIKAYSRYLLAAGLMAGLVGVLAYLAGTLGSLAIPTYSIIILATVPLPPLAATPGEPLARLDAAIADYLESGQPQYGDMPLAASGAALPPISAYLPRDGNTRFTLPVTPLATPTPVIPAALPYPTSPPLPTLAVPTTAPGSPTPDLVATVQAFAVSVPYGAYTLHADNCAPAGRPIDGLLTQYYSSRHTGIDLAVPIGTPVTTTHSGVITWAGWNAYGYGNLVIVQNGAYITYYAHLNAPNVNVGDYVVRGAIIGWSGSTGNSSGPHVHYETRIDDVPVDPLTFENRGYGTC